MAYYTLQYVNDLPLQIDIIIVTSFIGTIFLYEIIKRIPYVRVLLGIK